MKILLAVDGSEYTKKMLAYLATHEELLGGNHQYTALTVQAPLPTRARAALGKEVVDRYHAEESEKVLAPVSKFLLRHGINAKTDWKVGPAGAAIAKLAESVNAPRQHQFQTDEQGNIVENEANFLGSLAVYRLTCKR